jgi:YidC/Oxa1 family membrane protein insertase
MSTFFGVPVDAAYHVVSMFARVLSPLLGGLAGAVAIVLFTMAVRLLVLPLSYRAMRGMETQTRLAPAIAGLRSKHASNPERLQRELTALYKSEGTSMFAGCLPMLLQWPFLSVMYLLFRSPKIGSAANTLLAHGLFGAPLGSHWLGGAGPLSAQGAVFAGLFLLLAAVGWLSARITKRLASPASTPAQTPAPSRTSAPSRASTPSRASDTSRTSTSASTSAPALGVMVRLMPYVSVVMAAFVPLAAGLYLVTSAAWTLAERTLLGRTRRDAGASA